jgi:ABC-type Fe3+/spermidine/putrescine transport system ATPase subunit
LSNIVLRNLVKRFGATVAVDNINLEIAQGELFSLLGSSGCGKTTTLRCVAGLETPTSGEILLDGQDVAHVPSFERDCGMVFQNYALFPHMTVAENVAYGLLARRYKQAGLLGRLGALVRSVWASTTLEDRQRVKEALRMVELEGLEKRRPGQLSGGQQQRVALARALVIRPRVVLFDEPLGALDAKLRIKMREEIRRIQKMSGITSLYVTHDQEEALSISDRLAVMNCGRVVQMGTPEELYLRPRSRFLAEFIGLTNIFTAVVEGPGRAAVEGSAVVLATALALPPRGSKVSLAVRPEAVRLLDPQDPPLENCLTGVVQLRMFMGNLVKFVVAVDGLEITAAVPQATVPPWKPSDQVRLGFPAAEVLVLEDD